MKAYKILLCCGAGMSSGFLAQAAQKAANMMDFMSDRLFYMLVKIYFLFFQIG